MLLCLNTPALTDVLTSFLLSGHLETHFHWVNCFWFRHFGCLATLTSHCRLIWQRHWQDNGYRQYATCQNSEFRYIRQSENFTLWIFIWELAYWFSGSFVLLKKKSREIFIWNENKLKIHQESQKTAKI